LHVIWQNWPGILACAVFTFFSVRRLGRIDGANQTVIFPSRFPLDVAVARLSGACLADNANTLATSWLTGTITPTNVRLRWHGANVPKNARIPFQGKFIEHEGKACLQGQFEASSLFTYVIFFIFAYMPGFCVVQWLTVPSSNASSGVLTGCLMFGGMCLLLRASSNAASDQIAWISTELKSML
jgi:hypothetical protein